MRCKSSSSSVFLPCGCRIVTSSSSSVGAGSAGAGAAGAGRDSSSEEDEDDMEDMEEEMEEEEESDEEEDVFVEDEEEDSSNMELVLRVEKLLQSRIAGSGCRKSLAGVRMVGGGEDIRWGGAAAAAAATTTTTVVTATATVVTTTTAAAAIPMKGEKNSSIFIGGLQDLSPPLFPGHAIMFPPLIISTLSDLRTTKHVTMPPAERRPPAHRLLVDQS